MSYFFEAFIKTRDGKKSILINIDTIVSIIPNNDNTACTISFQCTESWLEILMSYEEVSEVIKGYHRDQWNIRNG